MDLDDVKHTSTEWDVEIRIMDEKTCLESILGGLAILKADQLLVLAIEVWFLI